MKYGNSPNKFIGALMGGLGGAIAGGARRRRGRGGEAAAMAQKARAGSQGVAPGQASQRLKRPAGLGQTLAGGGYQGFGVAPGQIMGQGRRRRGGMGMLGGALGALGGGFGGALGGFGGRRGFSPGFGGGFGRGMGGLLGGGFFKKDESSFKNVGKTGEYEESSAFQKKDPPLIKGATNITTPKKKIKKRSNFLNRWRNRRKFFNTDKKD
tara:strand:+ start:58 stop:687 length:630 start_codon:yes stop_codon:yes gene_type:complete